MVALVIEREVPVTTWAQTTLSLAFVHNSLKYYGGVLFVSCFVLAVLLTFYTSFKLGGHPSEFLQARV